ncbi:hypothetical protein RIF23_00700 [Lipingzhangella sp. LS1_29]|uniref:Secreted protein n=1 Tax=Lipingzhangella rawalii TaxID=2055835 RepID=A0ABU2H0H6_9ACTN|nr:hypothetical protein [Lipingzhangella rawalii]MDS1268807.1 hypothetical protein [Lipingzhangella rawalii]
MEPLSLVTGAAIALSGVVLGRLLAGRRRQPARGHRSALTGPSGTPQAICGCGHHLVFHDNETRKCRAQVIIPGRWTGERGDSHHTCVCQGYRGPMPVDEYFAPDIMPDGPDSSSR